jgi:hypothetical protein
MLVLHVTRSTLLHNCRTQKQWATLYFQAFSLGDTAT